MRLRSENSRDEESTPSVTRPPSRILRTALIASAVIDGDAALAAAPAGGAARHCPLFFFFFSKIPETGSFAKVPINLNDGENETRISYIIYNFFFLKIFIIQPHVDSKMKILVSRNNNVISERTVCEPSKYTYNATILTNV